MILPKSNQDSNSEKRINPKDSQEKLLKARKKILMLKRNLEQDFTEALPDTKLKAIEIKLEGLNDVVTHIERIFGNKTWIGEIEEIIEKEIELDSLRERIEKVEHKTLEVEAKVLEEEAVRSVLSSLKEAGVSARKERSFDKAIEILQDIDTKLLPAIEAYIPAKDKKDIKSSSLKELGKTLLQQGKIDEAIKVIDACCTDPDFDSNEYIESQINKSHLLVKKGEFNQAINLLKEIINYEKCLPDNERKPEQSAEIKRWLAMSYRGQGAYKEAVKWFNEAKEEFRKSEDEEGFNNALWGIGILRHLTGEWEKAIEIWEQLLAFFEKQPDSLYKGKEPTSTYQIKVYFEYSRTLQLCGKFKEAEEVLNKALTLNQDLQGEYTDWMEAYLHLLFSQLYYQQNKIEKASEAIAEVRRINKLMGSHQKETIDELKILKSEINVLLALNKAEEARKKLLDQYEKCKSNWDQATYYHLLGIIEKSEMNFGLAKKALKSSLDKTKEIGASSLSDELMYIELLVEMSRTGNQKAYKEAESLLTKLETEVTRKKLSAFILECNLLKAHLARIHYNYDKSYQLYSEIVREADSYRLFRQKSKALEGIRLIEQEGQQLRTTRAREMSVYRYLEDARRILEENS